MVQPADRRRAAARRRRSRGDYYREREARGRGARRADRARHSRRGGRSPATRTPCGARSSAEVAQGRVGLVEVYRATSRGGPRPRRRAARRGRVAGPPARLRRGRRPIVWRRAWLGGTATQAAGAARGRRRARPRRRRDPRRVRPCSSASSSRAITCRASSRCTPGGSPRPTRTTSQLRALKRPLQGVYLSLFLMMTLMILVSATWTGLYLAKRITRPVQRLAAGRARDRRRPSRSSHRAGDAGRVRLAGRGLQHHGGGAGGEPAQARTLAPRSRAEEPASSTSAAATSRRCSSASRPASSRSAPTAASRRSTAPRSGCSRSIGRRRLARRRGVPPRGSAAARRAVCGRPAWSDRRPRRRRSRSRATAARSTSPPRRRRCQREDGSVDGAVLVFDDVTPLIRTQRVAAWRDVARRLAHEIKNPLTPIQLCAERMRRHFSAAAPASRELVDECTTTIVGEVESLKALVDEFAQFARMPAPRAVPTDLNVVLADTLALYNGLFREIQIERRFAAALPPVRVDVEQIRRVVINLVDNAVEALGGSAAAPRPDGQAPTIIVETQHDRGQRRRPHPRHRQRPGNSRGRSRQAVHAVLLDEAARQRPRPRHRPPHHRRARRQHRGRRQRADRDGVHHRVAAVIMNLTISDLRFAI